MLSTHAVSPQTTNINDYLNTSPDRVIGDQETTNSNEHFVDSSSERSTSDEETTGSISEHWNSSTPASIEHTSLYDDELVSIKTGSKETNVQTTDCRFINDFNDFKKHRKA